MSTTTAPTTSTATFEVIPTANGQGYLVLKNGLPITDAAGNTRVFATANSARKRISRERRGDYHR